MLLLCDVWRTRRWRQEESPTMLRICRYLPIPQRQLKYPDVRQSPKSGLLHSQPAESVLCTCLNWCLKLPDPLLHFRIWNPLTRISRTHCLPSTHLLRPRQPRCSGSCSAWQRDSMVGMGCAASLTSSFQPRGPYSTCSRKPVWVCAPQGPKPVWDPPLGTEPVWWSSLQKEACETLPGR